jgi:hypothetical protein
MDFGNYKAICSTFIILPARHRTFPAFCPYGLSLAMKSAQLLGRVPKAPVKKTIRIAVPNCESNRKPDEYPTVGAGAVTEGWTAQSVRSPAGEVQTTKTSRGSRQQRYNAPEVSSTVNRSHQKVITQNC